MLRIYYHDLNIKYSPGVKYFVKFFILGFADIEEVILHTHEFSIILILGMLLLVNVFQESWQYLLQNKIEGVIIITITPLLSQYITLSIIYIILLST